MSVVVVLASVDTALSKIMTHVQSNVSERGRFREDSSGTFSEGRKHLGRTFLHVGTVPSEEGKDGWTEGRKKKKGRKEGKKGKEGRKERK